MSEIIEPERLLRRERANYRRSVKRLTQRIQRHVRASRSFNKLEKQVLERMFVSWVEKIDSSTAVSLWDFLQSAGRRKDDFEEVLFSESVKLGDSASLSGQEIDELAVRVEREVDKRRRKWLSGQAFGQAEKLKKLVREKEKEKLAELHALDLHKKKHKKKKHEVKGLEVFGVIDERKIERVDWSNETEKIRSELILKQAEKEFDSKRFMLDFGGKKKKVKK